MRNRGPASADNLISVTLSTSADEFVFVHALTMAEPIDLFVDLDQWDADLRFLDRHQCSNVIAVSISDGLKPGGSFMPSVVTLTMNPSLDIASATDRIAPDEKLRCEVPQYDAGGGGLNVARAIKLLGGDPLAIFPVGGPSGAVVSDLLRDAGVRFHAIPIQGSIRENVHITEQSSGAQYRFVMPGPTISEAEQEACLDALAHVSPHSGVCRGKRQPSARRSERFLFSSRRGREFNWCEADSRCFWPSPPALRQRRVSTEDQPRGIGRLRWPRPCQRRRTRTNHTRNVG